MAFQELEYEFPDPDKQGEGALEVDIEPSSAQTLGEDPPEAKKPLEDDDDEFDIEVVDDTPPEDRDRKPSPEPDEVTDAELEGYSSKVRKRINSISKGYHDERRAKETALRERQELETLTQRLIDENKALKGSANKSQTALIEQAKRAMEGELQEAKRKYKEAYEAGDVDAVVEAQDSLTNARIKAERVNNLKSPPVQDETDAVSSDQTPVASTQPAPDPQAIAWQQENSWFGVNDEMTSFAYGLHNRLIKEGVNPQSSEYYEKINSRMRKIFPESFDEVPADASRQSSTVVAPATRSTPPKKVTLSKTQQRLAKRLGLTLEQYAKQVALDARKS